VVAPPRLGPGWAEGGFLAGAPMGAWAAAPAHGRRPAPPAAAARPEPRPTVAPPLFGHKSGKRFQGQPRAARICSQGVNLPSPVVRPLLALIHRAQDRAATKDPLGGIPSRCSASHGH